MTDPHYSAIVISRSDIHYILCCYWYFRTVTPCYGSCMSKKLPGTYHFLNFYGVLWFPSFHFLVIYANGGDTRNKEQVKGGGVPFSLLFDFPPLKRLGDF